MTIILSSLLLVGSLAWIWGALTGRLASMIAALVQPNWVTGGSPVPPAGAGGY